MVIHNLMDACEFILEEQGEPQSSYWLASQVMEMKLWRASEAGVQRALVADINKHGESSPFLRVGKDEFALRSWAEVKGLQEYRPAKSPRRKSRSARKRPAQRKSSFPAISQWVQSYGWIEVGQQDRFGFVVRTLDDGGIAFEDDAAATFGEAMAALEKGLQELFGEEG